MSAVSDQYRALWWGNRFFGEAKPNFVVKVRYGRFKRAYGTWEDPETGDPERYGEFAGGKGYNKPWQATWTPAYLDEESQHYDPGDPEKGYKTIDGAQEFDCNQDFEQNGLTSATIISPNVRLVEKAGVSGTYHIFERGYLAPWRGQRTAGRQHDSRQVKNDWYSILAYNVQITVWAGFGSVLEKVFTGLVDDVDLSSTPDKVTVSARCFGQVLVDSRIYKDNKDPILWSPITFADRRGSDEVEEVGGNGPDDSSSNLPGHHPRMVVDDNDSWWGSQNRGSPNHTEWVQIKVPKGRYESIKIDPKYDGMEAYISIKAKGESKLNGEALPAGQWVDVDKGEVPGDNGGHQYVRRYLSLPGRERTYSLGGIFRLDHDSVIRVSFRNLKHVGQDKYRAGVTTLRGLRRTVLEEAVENRHTQWIRVDDVADVVRIILRWAGFKEWRVELTGAKLNEKSVFTPSAYYMDAIKQLAEWTGFVFYIDRPSDDDLSIGVPVFERNHAVRADDDIEAVTDRHLLTGVQVKLSDAPLASAIRVRGAVSNLKKGVFAGTPTGRALRDNFLGDGTYRKAFMYVPPWMRRRRLAGIIKHFNHLDQKLKSQKECKIAALHIALAQALQSATCTMEIPPNPAITLDGHVLLIDLGTGMNTRVYIANRSLRWAKGERNEAKMTLGGSLIDLPDISEVVSELAEMSRSDTGSVREGDGRTSNDAVATYA